MIDMAHADRKPVVLVADDDEVARLLIESVLADADFRVVHAQDGREAVDAFPREQPDIVLLDINMPVMDGYETCRTLRALPGGERVPILMVTAHEGMPSIDLAYEAGATDFLTKSSNWTLVAHRVRYMLRSTGIWGDAETSPQRRDPSKDAARPCDWQWRSDKDCFALSQELRDLLGLAATDAEMSRARYLDAIPAQDRRHLRAALVAALRNARDLEVVHRLRLPDGSLRGVRVYAELQFDPSGRLERVCGTLEDAAALPEEVRVGRADRYDGLTGLPNRPMFRERLSRAIAACARAGQRLALMFLDLDQFKCVNDAHGHAVGDQVLASAAKRLAASLAGNEPARGVGAGGAAETARQRHWLGRMGGDRFCLFLSNIRDASDAAEAARRIFADLARPMQVGAHEIALGASMGIAMYPDDGTDSEALLHRAEAAAYHAREEGSNNFHFFASAMNARALRRPALEDELRQALDKGEFELHYQPLISMTDGRVVGAEALIRWRHPQLGLLLPAQFMGLAEDSGLIVPMGEWVLACACNEAANWRDISQFAPSVSVNLSSAQLRHPALVQSLQRALDMSTLQARLLTLEMSEATLCEDADAALAVTQQLAATGVRLCMDNFSASRAALMQLRRLPLQAVKIDRSIVLELPGNPSAAAQARAFAGMTDSLMLSAAAEGVETRAQLQFLREIGCKTCQGYLFGRPLPAEAFTQLLQREPGARGDTRH